jgi:hypothetical protein
LITLIRGGAAALAIIANGAIILLPPRQIRELMVAVTAFASTDTLP